MNSVVVILCLFLWAFWQVGAGEGRGGVSSLKMWKTECENGKIFIRVPHLPARVNH